MKPTIGASVIYTLNDSDKQLLRDYNSYAETQQCNISDELPAIIVRVWSNNCVNLKVITDGQIGDMWKTSISNDETQQQAGTWRWPEQKQVNKCYADNCCKDPGEEKL